MLDKNKFVVKSASTLFSSKEGYEIVDPESNQVLGTAEVKSSFWGKIFGSILGDENMSKTIEVCQTGSEAPVFSVRRSGFFIKKIQALDEAGQVVGSYKAKAFSLSGGYHIYDKDGNHVAEIKGNLFKADYKFLTPSGEEMGSVSQSWGGLAKALLTGAGTYGVEIAPAYDHLPTAKMLILGAAIAIDSLFKTKKSTASKGAEMAAKTVTPEE
jgi:uncharacterized protein YxjI